MSSHREAPEISKDPVADSTDVYAFVSPDRPDTVTLITNYVPLQGPAGGPNFYEFGDDVLYEIHVDNDGDAQPDVTYQFRFTTEVRNPRTFLYNTGPIDSPGSAKWNQRQFYSVRKVDGRCSRLLASGVPCPPCNIGPRSTPDLAGLADARGDNPADRREGLRRSACRGLLRRPRFDLRPGRPPAIQNLHLLPLPVAAGVNATAQLNVHTSAIQVPITDLTRNRRRPDDLADAAATIGAYTSASRQKVLIRDDDADRGTGPFTQVSRLGNALFNEVIVPMALKDRWNAEEPADDKKFADFVRRPELAALLPVLYPGVFPNLAALRGSRRPGGRAAHRDPVRG